jgi:uncharacterized protein YgbK (DUF1537 family)
MSDLRPKIIVLDDDPTGSQTVHSCLLLTQWDVPTLCSGLRDASPLMFILTNTRSLTPEAAADVTQTVCRNLREAIAQVGLHEFLVVSRSDSTLRGHYPLETDGIAAELGPFDAHFLVPAFFEGGRFTRDSIHYLIVTGQPTPVHETEFARDRVFGYRHSYLPDYVEEKTQGRIPATVVERFLLEDIRNSCQGRLRSLTNNACGVVDAECQADLDQFAADVLAVVAEGKRFLFRSAASLLTALAQLPPQPIPPEQMATYVQPGRLGVFVVGSHVQKTTDQLMALLACSAVEGIEIEVAQLAGAEETVETGLRARVRDRIQAAFAAGKTPVIYTSREELTFGDTETRLQFGIRVSNLLMAIVRDLPAEVGYLVSKGGITSNDVLSRGLALPTARLLGQIIPGCSVVCTPADHRHLPNIPVVLFPGNVGEIDGLVVTLQRLTVQS